MKEEKLLSGYIVSIIALVFSFITPFGGLILGIVGLVQTKKGKGDLAKKGKVMSIIAICISVIFIVIALLISAGVINLPEVPAY